MNKKTRTSFVLVSRFCHYFQLLAPVSLYFESFPYANVLVAELFFAGATQARPRGMSQVG